MKNTEIILKKFELNEEQFALVRAAGNILRPHLDRLMSEWYDWLREQPDYKRAFSDEGAVERVRSLQIKNWQEFFLATINPDYIARRKHIGAVHARIELPNDVYIAGMAKALELFSTTLRESAGENYEKLFLAITRMCFFDTALVMDEIGSIASHKIAEHGRALMEMSTPVTAIWEGILLLPLVGIIDSRRTQDIMEKSLQKISETRARMFVVDISGVAAVDTGVANHLIKITRATRLMGCESIISGLSPAIASTLVELGVDVKDIRTTATLRDAFELALESLPSQSQPHAGSRAGSARAGTASQGN